MIYDATQCILGEGPLWHPERGELFWFDIVGKRLHRKGQSWEFPGHVSAAGWVDRDTLLVASETALHRFDLTTGASDLVTPLEAHIPGNRSNDGRADPYGGFWIGTMSKSEEAGAASFYRYYRGELRQLWAGATVTNAQCFSPDGSFAHFSDTVTHKVMRVRLDRDGWPAGEPEVYLDFSAEGLYPDGAVIDAGGNMWLAHWAKGRVVGYDPKGREIGRFEVPAPQSTCPAFGGPELTTLFVTSAARDMTDGNPAHGQTFAFETDIKGQAEPRVIL